MNEITVSKIVEYVDSKHTHIKNNNEKIIGISSITKAKKGTMTFCSTDSKKGVDNTKKSKASLIICPESFKQVLNNNSSYIFVKQPRLWFLRCIKKFFEKEEISGIHESAIVETRKIGKNVLIGPFTYIAKDVEIGANTKILANVSILDNSKIGANVLISESCVIGAKGLGPQRNNNKKLERFPQLGGTEIKDDVEIGANVCIMKGTIDNTIIGKGVHIAPLVNIGHNVTIGKNCYVTPHAIISGSSSIGENSFIGAGSFIRDQIKIGKNVTVGMGTVVTKNVSDGVTIIGNPGKIMNKNN
jgi:UDP-3-O-[3-hydroxymyristoyl] glucosamine N-acyltransferase